MRQIGPALVLVCALGARAVAATADAGVLEINQTCATQTGCFGGDTAGFPVTITGTVGRSFRLTSDLVVPNENTDAITVSVPSASLDLAGFEIVRAACVGSTSSCVAVGSGFGVRVSAVAIPGVAVRNGSITGMGASGVSLGLQSEIRGLRLRWNGGSGAVVGSSSLVVGCTAWENAGQAGILCDHACTASGDVAYRNAAVGIWGGIGSTISESTAHQNGTEGFLAAQGSTIRGNTAYANHGDGIATSIGATVSGNSAYVNLGDGIQVSSGSLVENNTVRGNSGLGLVLGGSQATYRGNVITLNTGGTVSAGGVNAGGNVCNGVLCP